MAYNLGQNAADPYAGLPPAVIAQIQQGQAAQMQAGLAPTFGAPQGVTPGSPAGGYQYANVGSGPSFTGASNGQTPTPAGTMTPDQVRQYITTFQQSHPASTQSMLQLIDELKQKGVQVSRATHGVNGSLQSDDKITFPDGSGVDLIGGVDGPNPTWAYQPYGGGVAGGGASGGSAGGPGLLDPFTGTFKSPGDFVAPQLNETTDPGYAARLQMGVDALQRSAAAKGTLVTGGTLKDLTQYAQDYGSNEYQNVYNRALTGNELQYNRALGEFQLGYDIFRNNQNDPYNKLMGTASLGLSGAGQTAGYDSSYGTQSSSNSQSQGNVNAGKDVTLGNIGSSGATSGANGATSAYNAYKNWKAQQPTGGISGGATGGNINNYPAPYDDGQ